MYGKLLFVTGAAVGFLVGTKTGREGLEKIKGQVKDVWEKPQVQKTVSDAQRFAEDKFPTATARVSEFTGKAKDVAKDVADDASDVADAAADAASSASDSPTPGSSTPVTPIGNPTPSNPGV